jgi:F0F1-type ATP synthase assembly protein I
MNASHAHPARDQQHPRRNAASAMVRAKKIDLASSLGAGVIGGGLGVLLARYVDSAPYAIALIAVGIGLHGWGMLERRRLEISAPRALWVEGLYWLCWVILVVIAAFALFGR